MNQGTTFSERLRLLLAERGMTQLELAAKVGVTRAAMSRYVSGEREPRFATLLRIAEVLEVHTAELLDSAAPTGQVVLRLVARTTLSDAEKGRLREMIDGGEAP